MTKTSFDVLRHLADGAFHSGAALARALDVSRGTVWNAVCALENAGLTIYKAKGRGYKLAQPISLLDREAIRSDTGAHASRFSIDVVDKSESTNTALLQQAACGASCGTVLAAEWQSSGRGRMGRPWRAGIGDALTFSLLWRFTQGASALAGLSLGVGVALIRALERIGARGVGLKWPNDVLWKNAKLAGILIEMQGDALGPSAVVIGVGLNVRLADAVRKSIDQPAADLETICAHALDRNAVLGLLLAELAEVLEDFSANGFAPLRNEWERHHACQGKRITVKLPTGRVEHGVARGVGDDGALLFQQGEAVRRLHSAEVSVREAVRQTSTASAAPVRSGT